MPALQNNAAKHIIKTKDTTKDKKEKPRGCLEVARAQATNARTTNPEHWNTFLSSTEVQATEHYLPSSTFQVTSNTY
jgi:hypothetical protein